MMISTDLKKRLAAIQSLSTLPVVASNVIQLTQNPKSSAMQVGEALSHDPALVTKVLQVANSAFYGFPRKITTITYAIVVLGFVNIRNLVLSASLFDMLSTGTRGPYFDRTHFWKHSLACGIISKLLARMNGIKNVEEAFIWGLLHDLGKIVLYSHFRDEFDQAMALAVERDMTVQDAEIQVFGLDHGEIGAMLTDQWNLPPTLTKVVRYHHCPSAADESVRMAAMVHIADALCRRAGKHCGHSFKAAPIDKVAWALFKLDKDKVAGLLTEFETEMANALEFLPDSRQAA